LYYYDLRNRLGYVSKNTSMYDFIKYTLDSRGRRTALYQYYGAYPTKDINMSYSGGTSVYERDYVMNGMDLVRDVTQIFYRGSDYGGGVGGLLYASNLDGTDLNYKHYNLRGDVIQSTLDNGTIKNSMYYTAFGELKTTGTTPTDSFRSNTKYVDSFGIINEGFRCRQTNSDRFLTPDPLEYVDGLNQYLYCSQNPWGKYDALGLSSNLYWNFADTARMRFQYTTVNMPDTKNVITIESVSEFRSAFSKISDSNDKIKTLNITAHGTENPRNPSENGSVSLGKKNGDNASLITGERWISNSDSVMNLRSDASVDLLKSSISDDAKMKFDVCYGAAENGIGRAFKEAIPTAKVEGYKEDAHAPFGMFNMPAFTFPGTERGKEIILDAPKPSSTPPPESASDDSNN